MSRLSLRGALSHSTKVDRLEIKVDKVVLGIVFPKSRALSTEPFCLEGFPDLVLGGDISNSLRARRMEEHRRCTHVQDVPRSNEGPAPPHTPSTHTPASQAHKFRTLGARTQQKVLCPDPLPRGHCAAGCASWNSIPGDTGHWGWAMAGAWPPPLFRNETQMSPSTPELWKPEFLLPPPDAAPLPCFSYLEEDGWACGLEK